MVSLLVLRRSCRPLKGLYLLFRVSIGSGRTGYDTYHIGGLLEGFYFQRKSVATNCLEAPRKGGSQRRNVGVETPGIIEFSDALGSCSLR